MRMLRIFQNHNVIALHYNAIRTLCQACHCSKYSNSEFVGGDAVDELDKMCLEWNNKLKCLTLQGGACENGIDFSFFNFQVNNDGSPRY